MRKGGDVDRLLTDEAGRAAAIEELGWHRDCGRIGDDVYLIRVERAERARSKADLAVLFADLPRQQTMPAGSVYTDRVERARARRHAGYKAVAIATAVAMFLMLLLGLEFEGWAWSWVFLLIPIVTVAVEWGNLRAKPAEIKLVI